jgi:hypothetical protein
VYAPVWEGPVRLTAAKFIRKNKWRVDAIHEAEDLLQDAWLLFNKLQSRYSVNSARQFMALFKRALANRFNDHSMYMRRKRASGCRAFDQELADRIIGEVANDGYLNALLQGLPNEIQLALGVFDDPILCAALRRRQRRKGRGVRPRENLNMKLCRLTGAPKGEDLVGQIKAWLT